MTKRILVALSAILLFLTGCKPIQDFHDGTGTSWIQEQVEKGNLTQAQADELLKQETK